MKNYISLRLDQKRLSLHLFFLILLSFFLISCEKEEIDSNELSALNAEAAVTGTVDHKAAKKMGAPAPGEDPIAAIAIEGGYNELVIALTYVDKELDAGLVDLFLNGTDQYTVFAPTDAAFLALYEKLEGVNQISDLPAPVVLDVLLYHVTEGRRAANSVVPPKNYRQIETLSGEKFQVNPQGEIEAIGSTANITAANISASNGIIHEIDQVLLPFKL